MSSLPHILYEESAGEYLKSLPPKHFMEATPQATQRKITLESFDLVKLRRSDVHVLNELLVQFPRRGEPNPGQVVPDNMVVLHNGTIKAKENYAVPLQPALPFLVIDYVSKAGERKNYEENFRVYERELKVPYYLVFDPDNEELALCRHNGKKYVCDTPNGQGRYSIPELEMEVGLLDGWARFWLQGALLPLPAELQRDLDQARAQRAQERKRADDAEKRLEEQERRSQDLER
jgi:Uma2 family endonuclease